LRNPCMDGDGLVVTGRAVSDEYLPDEGTLIRNRAMVFRTQDEAETVMDRLRGERLTCVARWQRQQLRDPNNAVTDMRVAPLAVEAGGDEAYGLRTSFMIISDNGERTIRWYADVVDVRLGDSVSQVTLISALMPVGTAERAHLVEIIAGRGVASSAASSSGTVLRVRQLRVGLVSSAWPERTA